MQTTLPLLLSAALLAPLAQDPRPEAAPATGQREARLAETIEREAREIARAVSGIVEPTVGLARVKAVEAREMASEVEAWAAQAAQAGREAFLAGREAYELAIASNQDPEERIARALEAARAEVERLQAELERSRVTRRQEELRRGAERIRLDALDRTELHELRQRIEEQLQRQGELEQGAERSRRWRVVGEPGVPPSRVAVPAPAVPGVRVRRLEGGPDGVQIERVEGLSSLSVPRSIEIEVEASDLNGESRAVRVAPRAARALSLGEPAPMPLIVEALGQAGETMPPPRFIEILRSRESHDGVQRPARILLRKADGDVQVIEAEDLELLDTRPAPPVPPMAPTAAAPRAGRVALSVPATPSAPAQPAQDTEKALVEVTNLVREMVAEVRDLRASLEDLRAQVQGQRNR